MAQPTRFKPTWLAPHPGESFTDCLEEYGVDIEILARTWDIPLDDLRALQRGERKIDDRMATAFSQTFIPDWRGIPAYESSEAGRKALWLRLQERYDADQKECVKKN